MQLRALLLDPPSPEAGEALWERYEHRALDEVYPVLMRMVIDNTIYSAARYWGKEQTFAGPTPPPGWTGADRKKVVTATIDDAIVYFKHKALQEWRPDGGTSLKTWFTNCCLMHFVAAFNRWYTETRLASSITRQGESREQIDSNPVYVTSYDAAGREYMRTELVHPGPGPEELACLRDEAERAMAAAPLKDNQAYRTYLQLEVDGYTPRERREITGLAPHIVRTRKSQHRRALQGPADAHGDPPQADADLSGELPDSSERSDLT
ncbi:hypothetical protein ACIA49_38585 [Kribbella sp. NPDC051587]|uniref:hypothetical protein n=1 Tax=Kribbella sp. NPDC051587 TaxID=3364119 RepID=UPI00379FD58D